VKLTHQFTVPVPVDEAWDTLLDLERVAPCLPGASVDSLEGDLCTGKVKVKVGPISMTYGGEVTILERDVLGRRVTMSAQGKELRGTSKATAQVVATLAPAEAGTTTVTVGTDLDLTGKPAQFGRGIITDVSNRLIGAFADNLAQLLGTPEPVAEPEETAESAPPLAAAPDVAEAPSLDLVGLLAPRLGAVAGVAVPALLAFVLGLVLGRRRR
jgi:uncharacterized protein